MQDRRKNPRRKTYFGARVVYNHRQCTMDGILKNVGSQGAKLVFQRPALIPDEFDLQVARMEKSYRARVAWRGSQELGVSFLDEGTTTNVIPLDPAIRISRLEAAKARLQARVDQLSTAD